MDKSTRSTIEFLLSLSPATLRIITAVLWHESQTNEDAINMLHHVIMVRVYKVTK